MKISSFETYTNVVKITSAMYTDFRAAIFYEGQGHLYWEPKTI